MTQDWNKRLKVAYDESSRFPGRPVRLPASGPMTVSGEGDQVRIFMRADAVVLNMQINAAAFEGWSLALKRWCDVETVTLEWDPPTGVEFTVQQYRHYQRFLYRIARFRSLFPDWFVVPSWEKRKSDSSRPISFNLKPRAAGWAGRTGSI